MWLKSLNTFGFLLIWNLCIWLKLAEQIVLVPAAMHLQGYLQQNSLHFRTLIFYDPDGATHNYLDIFSETGDSPVRTYKTNTFRRSGFAKNNLPFLQIV